MRFYIVRISTNELVEIINKPSLDAALMYAGKVYGDDSDTDLFTDERWREK